MNTLELYKHYQSDRGEVQSFWREPLESQRSESTCKYKFVAKYLVSTTEKIPYRAPAKDHRVFKSALYLILILAVQLLCLPDRVAKVNRIGDVFVRTGTVYHDCVILWRN